MNKPTKPKIFSPIEAANYLGTKEGTIKRLVKEGKIKIVKLGQSYIITEEAIIDYIESNAQVYVVKKRKKKDLPPDATPKRRKEKPAQETGYQESST